MVQRLPSKHTRSLELLFMHMLVASTSSVTRENENVVHILIACTFLYSCWSLFYLHFTCTLLLKLYNVSSTVLFDVRLTSELTFIVLLCRTHTAVKIAPQYLGPTVHVLDASKSVVVVCTSTCFPFLLLSLLLLLVESNLPCWLTMEPGWCFFFRLYLLLAQPIRKLHLSCYRAF